MADEQEVVRLGRIEGWPLPEEQADWWGDPAAEQALLESYRGGQLHHAWLLGGPRGIGKATLAYRFARFVLARPERERLAAASTLALPGDHPAFRKVAQRSHPNLITLARPWDDERKRFRTELTVDEIRRTIPFFGSTAGEDGWRIAVVDSADDMNPNAANALLKMLEEPPPRSLFLVIAHAPLRLLPTIRSRCRRLTLAPLRVDAIGAALARSPGAHSPADRGFAAELAGGSLRRAIQLLEEGGADLYRSFNDLVARLPELDMEALHRFADRIGRRGQDDGYEAFLDLGRDWVGRRVRRQNEPGNSAALPPPVAAAPLARWADVWEKTERSSALAEELNLDRKQVVLSFFMTLARTIRM